MVTNRRLVSLGSDRYFTPPWATHALLQKEQFSGLIWEPACGDGWISKVLLDYDYYVISSDLRQPNQYGASGADFLSANNHVANIITNPPYSQLEAFMKKGIVLARKKFCLLMRLAALAGGKRWSTIYSITPPTRVHIFCERITMYPNGIVKGGTGTTEFAWYVWDKLDPTYGKLNSTRVNWIEPGTRRRFEKSEEEEA